MTYLTEPEKRAAIIAHCLKFADTGLSVGTSGNVSIRHDDGMLISPTSTPYDTLTPGMITHVAKDGTWDGPIAPSSEWRFHRDIYTSRPDVNAIVLGHPNFCTVLAIHNMPIPAVHYMVAIFGSTDVRVAPYAVFGSQDLSDNAVKALEERYACLLQHHGAIAVADTIERAFFRLEELEVLARQYHGAMLLGDVPVLSDDQMAEVLAKIPGYGTNWPGVTQPQAWPGAT